MLPIYPMTIYVLAGAVAFVCGPAAVIVCQSAPSVALLLVWHLGDAVSGFYPNYLAYFSPVAGWYPAQGYKRLVDSSLDWGMDLPGPEALAGRQ